MHTYLIGLLWVLGAAALAGTVAWLVRRFGLDQGRPDNNEAVGQVFTIVSGLHAVVLAFVLVTLFDTVGSVHDGSYQEAQELVACSWASYPLSAPVWHQVREMSRGYATAVAQREWPRMSAGQDVRGTGWQQLDRIRLVIARAPAQGEYEEGRKAEAMEHLSAVSEQRQQRLVDANERGVAAVVWFVLVIGTVVSVLLPVFFGGTRLVTHVVIVSTLAGTLTLLLFAIFQLQNPFSSGSEIGPDAFRWAFDRLA